MLKTIAAFDRIGEENAFAVLARANALIAQGRDIINLGIGQPDFRTPDFIVEAAVKALREGHRGYTPATGIPPLREAVAADLHKRFNVEVSPDSVMIMPGGKPTMFMSILMFGEPGAEILYPDPGFPIYRSMIEFTGAKPVPVPIREENGFAFSAEETLKLITPKTRLLILNSPANPTGRSGQALIAARTGSAAGWEETRSGRCRHLRTSVSKWLDESSSVSQRRAQTQLTHYSRWSPLGSSIPLMTDLVPCCLCRLRETP